MPEDKKKATKSVQSANTTSKASSLFSFSSQERIIASLVFLLVGASFLLGYFYGQLTVLKGGQLVANGQEGTIAGTTPPTEAEPDVPITEKQWQDLLVSPAYARGNEDAEVTIVEFTDYQCPFCGRHFEQTDAQIQENYVDTGKVRYISRDLPLPFHPQAEAAAQAARCAGDQNKYWEMRELLFTNQDEWSSGDTEAMFSSYIGEIGANVATFNSCFSSGKYEQDVKDDLNFAQQVGASGTPTFFINGKKVVGAQPYSVFEAAIEAELE